MSILLASVQNKAEAITALEAGAGIIDVKDLAGGGMAAASVETWKEVTAAVNKRVPVSVTLGNPPQRPEKIVELAEQASEAGVDMVKIGVATSKQEAVDRIAKAAEQIKADVVLVYLVDIVSPRLPGATSHIKAVMMDTRDKDGKKLLEATSLPQIKRFINDAHKKGLTVGLAGRVSDYHLPELLPLKPDVIGVRGAIADDSRDGPISAEKVKQMVQLVA